MASSESTSLRILILVGSLDIGGTERHLCQVLPFLHVNTLEITVACFHHRGLLAPEMEALGVKVLSPEFPAWVKTARMLNILITFCWIAATIAKQRPNIVHTFLPTAYLLGGLCATILGVPGRVMSRRSLNLYQRRHPILTRVEFWLHKKMDLLIGNSAAVVDELRQEVDTRWTRIELILNGIDTEAFNKPLPRQKVRTALNISEDALVIILVANIIPYKGHSDLMKALAYVGHQFSSPWKLLCVGRDDGLLSDLLEKAKRFNLQNNISWLGPRHDIANLLCAADIGVLPSHEEGLSNFVLESMAAGLPMIVTDAGGNGELVVHGKTGLVVPKKAPDELGEAILQLANNKNQRVQMGNAARRRQADEFSLERCIQNYRKAYMSLGIAPCASQRS